MITPAQCLKVIGDPILEREMVVFDVPTALEVGAIPNKIYCNKRMVEPLTAAFTNIKARGLANEVKTWDGCFNIRPMKGSGGRNYSLHAWGLAIDINAAWNGYRKKPTMSAALVRCFTDAGFDWGGTWSVPDGMHFQLKKL